MRFLLRDRVMAILARRKLPLDQRSRSLPYKKEFVIAIIFTCVFYASIAAVLTSAAALFLRRNRDVAELLMASIFVCAGCWVVCLIKRRKPTCPLCKGAPFFESHARKHKKSHRAGPLNHSQTAILSSIFTQRFTCMYCGSPFDLQRPSKDQLNAMRAKAEASETAKTPRRRAKKMKVQR